MKQHYVVINDRLYPDDIAPLVLEEKLNGKDVEPFIGKIHYKNVEEWEFSDSIGRMDLNEYGLSESSILQMAGKMVKVNEAGETDLGISIYPGKPGIVFINDSV